MIFRYWRKSSLTVQPLNRSTLQPLMASPSEFMQDKGKVEINGRVGALIEIGAGFHPLLTGRENIYVNGAILGMSKEEVDEKFDDIVEFTEDLNRLIIYLYLNSWNTIYYGRR